MFRQKNIIALVLVMAIVAGFSSISFAAVPEDVIGTEYEEAVEVLNALSIMVGDTEGTFRPNDSIKRSEFAKVAVHLLGLESVAETTQGESKFPDVSSSHWASGYINVAESQGIIIGYPDGSFKPDNKITYAEALTILVRVTGYEPSAAKKGGFPTGYLVTAADAGIIGQTSQSGSSEASRGTVAELAFNSLTVKLMEQTGFGDNPVYSVVDKTLLSDKLKVEKGFGTVTANAISRLTGTSSLNDNEVEITTTSANIYKIGNSNAADYLGYNVEYYAKLLSNGNRELLLARPNSSKVSELVIQGSNIESVSTSKIEYWKNKEADEKTQSVTLSDNAVLIYNGKYAEFSAELIKPSAGYVSGYVTLVSNNGNDIYDLVVVNNFNNLVVEEVAVQSNRVTDKYGNASLVLNPDDKTLKFSITKDGKQIEITDLNEWDVVSYTKSIDGKYINAIVNSGKIIGKVTEIEDGKKIIDGVAYEVASNYTDNINLNDEGTFYLDIENKIAAVDATSVFSDNYAYLMDAGMTTAINSTLEIKLYTKAGETEVLKTANKVKVDTTTGLSPAQVLETLKNGGSVTPQLITYEVNSSGEITSIDRAEDKTGEGSLVHGAKEFTKNFAGNDIVYKSASGKLSNIVVGENTIVFDIPEGVTDSSNYAVRGKSFFENDQKYNIIAFNVADDLTAGAIIVTSSDGNTSAESSIAVVDKITSTQNDDGITVQKLYAYQDGKLVTLVTDSDGLLVKGGSTPLEQGDIIQFRTNLDGEIEKITVLFDTNNIGTEGHTTDGDMQIVVGKVAKKFASSINVTVNGGTPENYSLSGANIYSFDSSKAANRVTVISSADIQKYDSENPQYIFLRLYKDEVKEAVVIK